VSRWQCRIANDRGYLYRSLADHRGGDYIAALDAAGNARFG